MCSSKVAEVAGWLVCWPVTLTWQSGQYSPTRAPEQVIEVTRAADLRRVLLAARRDSYVRSYTYRLHREWDDSDAPRQCPRGHELTPGRARGRPCRCGVGHYVTDCYCGAVQHLPPLGPGCGALPVDPQAGEHNW